MIAFCKLFVSTILLAAISIHTMHHTNPPPTFILDFDDTITTQDTISVLAQSAISFHVKRNGKDFSEVWDGILRAYGEEYGRFVETYEPKKEDRRTVCEEIKFLREGRDVQERSFGRVSESGMFGGIGEVAFERFGEEAVRSGVVGIRNGFEEFVLLMRERDGKWGVVSVNWSESFIRGVLGTVGLDVDDVQILANEPDREGVLRGPRVGGGNRVSIMTTSDGKLVAMKDLVKFFGANGRGEEVVYIGDSGTDIECLMEDGTIGIIISAEGNGKMMETMDRSEIAVPHITEKKKGTKGVYWTSDFSEVVRSSLFQ